MKFLVIQLGNIGQRRFEPGEQTLFLGVGEHVRLDDRDIDAAVHHPGVRTANGTRLADHVGDVLQRRLADKRHQPAGRASITDDGATRRLVPLVGKAALQNIADMISQSRAVGGANARVTNRGVDIAIVQADVLAYAKEQGLFPGFESSLTYISKLYNEEFHIVARKEINSLKDLGGKQVNVDLRGSGTAITAAYLFDLLKLPVTVTNDSTEVALEKLRSGSIAAIAFVAGKPAPLFREITAEDGFHLLSIPLSPGVLSAYVPARLTAADYPNLVPRDGSVDTVAVGVVLVAADLQSVPERYRNLSNFVDAFFTGFSSLLAPGHHPKWQDVNLAAEFPG